MPSSDADLIQPSEEEARNGWTAETLTKYIREREKQQKAVIYGDNVDRNPHRTVNSYSIFG